MKNKPCTGFLEYCARKTILHATGKFAGNYNKTFFQAVKMDIKEGTALSFSRSIGFNQISKIVWVLEEGYTLLCAEDQPLTASREKLSEMQFHYGSMKTNRANMHSCLKWL